MIDDKCKTVASRVILIHNGRIVFDGPVDQMQSGGQDMETRFRQLTTASA